jgi:hypothetical protein
MKKLIFILLILSIFVFSSCQSSLYSIVDSSGCIGDTSCLACVNKPHVCAGSYEKSYQWTNGGCALGIYNYCANGCTNGACNTASTSQNACYSCELSAGIKTGKILQYDKLATENCLDGWTTTSITTCKSVCTREASCTKSDTFINEKTKTDIYTRGTLREFTTDCDTINEYKDTCVDSYTLKEYYCNGNNVAFNIVKAPDNYLCTEGRFGYSSIKYCDYTTARLQANMEICDGNKKVQCDDSGELFTSMCPSGTECKIASDTGIAQCKQIPNTCTAGDKKDYTCEGDSLTYSICQQSAFSTDVIWVTKKLDCPLYYGAEYHCIEGKQECVKGEVLPKVWCYQDHACIQLPNKKYCDPFPSYGTKSACDTAHVDECTDGTKVADCSVVSKGFRCTEDGIGLNIRLVADDKCKSGSISDYLPIIIIGISVLAILFIIAVVLIIRWMMKK